MRHLMNVTTVDNHLEIKSIPISSKYLNRKQSVKVVNNLFPQHRVLKQTLLWDLYLL